MGKTRAIGAARKLNKFRTKILAFHQKKQNKMVKQPCRDDTFRRPGMFNPSLYLSNLNVCDKCGCIPPKPENKKKNIFPDPDEWKKPKRGIDAFNALTSQCYQSYRYTGGKLVKIYLSHKYGGGLILKGIYEDVLIAAFERDGDTVDIAGLDWTL